MKNKILTYIALFGLLFALSCENEFINHELDKQQELSVSVSDANLEPSEAFFENKFTINWTPAHNQNTGSAIFYTLEIDTLGTDFFNPLLVLVEKQQNLLSYSIDYGTLSANLTKKGLKQDKTYNFTAKVTAHFAKTSVPTQTATVQFSIKPYKAVSTELYIVGNATEAGWTIENALQLTASNTHRGIFRFSGILMPGNFKFTTSRDACWCGDFYTKDIFNENKIIYNQGGSGSDNQWTVTERGRYDITVDLLNLSIKTEFVLLPPYSKLYLVGDASPSGWNIANPEAFTQSASDPFIFNYIGQLKEGDLKISTFTGDWCGGDWLNASVPNQSITSAGFIITHGCDGPDNKWHVNSAEAGNYQITVNFKTNSIAFVKLNFGANLIQNGEINSSANWNVYGVGWDEMPVSNFTSGKMIITNNPSNTYCNGIIWQAVEVEAGEYLFSADVSGGGMSSAWFEIMFGTTQPTNGSDYTTGKYIALLPDNGCGTSPFSGNIAEIGCGDSNYSGVGQNGLISFAKAQTIYFVIKAGTWDGTFGSNGISVDNISLRKKY